MNFNIENNLNMNHELHPPILRRQVANEFYDFYENYGYNMDIDVVDDMDVDVVNDIDVVDDMDIDVVNDIDVVDDMDVDVVNDIDVVDDMDVDVVNEFYDNVLNNINIDIDIDNEILLQPPILRRQVANEFYDINDNYGYNMDIDNELLQPPILRRQVANNILNIYINLN